MTKIITVSGITMAVIIGFVFYVLLGAIVESRLSFDVVSDYFWSTLFLVMSGSFALVCESVIVIFATCDYYKYRQMINIEGVCRNKGRLCISEAIAIYLFTLIVALFPIVMAFFGGFFDARKFAVFIDIPWLIVAAYFATAAMIYSFVIIVFAVCKIFRSKIWTLVICGVVLPFLLVSLAGFLAGGGLNPDYVNPAAALLDVVLGSNTESSVLQLIGVNAIENLFWILVAVIASRRRYEI